MQPLITFFEELGYMAHGMCLMWQPWLIALFAGSDFLIFVAYAMIPFAIFRVVRARPEIENRGVAYLFATFILLCGLTHLVAIFTLWIPAYAVQGVIKLATGVVSMLTAVMLFPMIPKVIALPSPSELRAVNGDLRDEIAAHEETLDELRRIRRELEDQVAARTRALERTNEELHITLWEAANRGRNLRCLTDALARQTANQTEGTEEFLKQFQTRISAMVEASDALIQPGATLSGTMRGLAENQLAAYRAAYPDRITLIGDEQPVSELAARQIGLVLNELATNAIKHGALRDEEGKVELSWAKYRGWPDAVDRFQICWTETLCASRRAENEAAELFSSGPVGFGSRVLNIAVPRRLDGRAEVDFTPNGLSYALDLPLKALVGPDPLASEDPAPAQYSGRRKIDDWPATEQRQPLRSSGLRTA
ncbi:sensor histidine kinase [Phaeobacter sp. J2-8]|uniref:sensor histidine kinase n=1 Tax=Phaeobacter sp. J2-8 TaxID=2931394 RepID=UPI001FD2AF80|nr:sensor histidine kinase [Phaeobacter sp. J2-8]MCJ7874183.1 sensor histidine kinase [Phaeobacter sp. J2-8]